MDERPANNNVSRGFAFFFYFICIFVGVRVWIEVVASEDRLSIGIAAVITLLVVTAACARYRRQQQLNANMRINRQEQLDFLTMIIRNRMVSGARSGGLTQSEIDGLPIKIYGSADREDHGNTLASNNNKDSLNFSEDTYALESGNQCVNECSVCLADYMTGDELICLPCSHFYHKPCISEWLLLHNNCPLCKQSVVVAQPAQENNQPATPGDIEAGRPRVVLSPHSNGPYGAAQSSPSYPPFILPSDASGRAIVMAEVRVVNDREGSSGGRNSPVLYSYVTVNGSNNNQSNSNNNNHSSNNGVYRPNGTARHFDRNIDEYHDESNV